MDWRSNEEPGIRADAGLTSEESKALDSSLIFQSVQADKTTVREVGSIRTRQPSMFIECTPFLGGLLHARQGTLALRANVRPGNAMISET
ncbi:hypothetical protein AMJ39_09000 [candidate division TA06 bacterium DG_24]|uniref:Uncharacterized protein n=1 Tax=candidate division TA06 bacterium DG_24 TaxID=1703770 RepID=A0A0S7WPK3_UNCT6|nr:MAG: hypothetical protein AMJ39_09000 [candidate division TA06 bacterium DG_24]